MGHYFKDFTELKSDKKLHVTRISEPSMITEFQLNIISIGNYTVREVLMKNRTRVWRNVYNTASACTSGIIISSVANPTI